MTLPTNYGYPIVPFCGVAAKKILARKNLCRKLTSNNFQDKHFKIIKSSSSCLCCLLYILMDR